MSLAVSLSRLRMASILCFITAIGLWLAACLTIPNEFQVSERQGNSNSSSPEESGRPLGIYLPYIGQGDATLIRSPDGKSFLIDAGPPGAGRKFLLPLLKQLGLNRLDGLLITHYDLDHLGGVPELLAGEDGEVGTIDDIKLTCAWDRGGVPYDSSPGLIPYFESLQETQTPRQAVELGQELALDPALKIRIVAVNGEVWDSSGNTSRVDLSPETFKEKENAASIALLIEYGNFRYLTAGDLTGGGMLNGFLTPDVESLLGEAIGEVDVLHADHHGSLSSSNANFVAATSPQAVFVQAGIKNPYGHPASEVVERWKHVGAELYSTEGGAGYILTSDGKDFQIETIDL